MLLAQRAAIEFKDKDGNTPLALSAANGHIACVQALIKGKADININFRRPGSADVPILQLATQMKRGDIVTLLKDAGAK